MLHTLHFIRCRSDHKLRFYREKISRTTVIEEAVQPKSFICSPTT